MHNVKHLEFVQNVITRMNDCSFKIKSMAIALSGAYLAFIAAVKTAETKYAIFLPILVPILLLVVMWFCDSYYLQQEIKFRGLYDDVVDGKIEDYKMPIANYNSKVNSKYGYFYALFSFSEVMFYIPMVVIIGISIISINGGINCG